MIYCYKQELKVCSVTNCIDESCQFIDERLVVYNPVLEDNKLLNKGCKIDK